MCIRDRVWSVNEGQQRFDTHVDKLMNYIRYWQASGESLKTSVRTRTRLEQLTGESHYTGGTVPYGYKRVRLGRVNKKNQEVCDLVIDEAEACLLYTSNDGDCFKSCLLKKCLLRKSVWNKCAACIGTMQNKWGLGTAQQAFCKAK